MKKTVFRIVSLSISVVLVLTAFCGCTEGGTTVAKPDYPVTVADGDGCRYSVIYSASSGNASHEVSQYISQELSTLTGKTVEAGSDLLLKGESSLNDKLEIAVGLVNRDESVTAHMVLDENDYSVTATKYKILILAGSDEKLKTAAQWFISNLEKKDGKLLLNSEYTYLDAEKVSLKIADTDITDFTIVVASEADDSELELAGNLQSLIARRTGKIIGIVTDDTKQSAHEIAVGNTARSISAASGASAVVDEEYSYSCKNGGLSVCAGSSLAVEYLISELEDKYLTAASNTIAEGTSANEKIVTDLRIMTSNVLFSDDYDTNYRMHCLAQTYLSYMPEILCLQECKPAQLNALTPLITGSYTAVPILASDSKNVYQQIFYRTGEYETVEYGYTRFREGVIPWGVSWAVLKRVSDGKQFCVMNTHLTIISDTYDAGSSNTVEGVALRKNDCNTILAQIDAVRAKHKDIPIMVCGDWNAYADSESLDPIDDSEFMANSMHIAKIESNITMNTAHILSKMPYYGGDIIDHIYVSEDVISVTKECVVVDGVVIQGSDHCPVYAEVIFN